MPIKGSFSNDKSLDPKNIEAMCLETVKDSVDGMKKEIAKRTPVDTRNLRNSLDTTEPKKTSTNRYKAEVFTDVEYARYVEYGTAPHEIAAKGAGALHFNGQFRDKVNHPGYEGAHMFMRGAADFEGTEAERVMRRNLRKYLK
jgi:hypothetical protein